jgi:hypothetical protein
MRSSWPVEHRGILLDIAKHFSKSRAIGLTLSVFNEFAPAPRGELGKILWLCRSPATRCRVNVSTSCFAARIAVAVERRHVFRHLPVVYRPAVRKNAAGLAVAFEKGRLRQPLAGGRRRPRLKEVPDAVLSASGSA